MPIVQGFGAMAVPDFIAGMLYGFTGDNNLQTLEDCVSGGTDIVNDSLHAIDEISSLDALRASLAILKVIDDIQDEVQYCPQDV